MIPNPSVCPSDGGLPRGSAARPAVRPFLKWAGGKRQLLPHLDRFVPATFSRYFEPFLGSGAMFLNLHARGRLESRPAILSDTNQDLIGSYVAVAQRVDDVVGELRLLAIGHQARGQRHYYAVRDERFNPLRCQIRTRRAGRAPEYPAALAAMFIYLNRTGFNGLYRLNASGDFNVPAGRYTNPQICDEANLRAVAAALQSSAADLRHASFEATVAECARGDFVYFDPPYAPLSSTSSFTSYTAQGFADADQRRLQEVVIDLVVRGCFVVLSNSTAPLISALYEAAPAARRAGLRAYRVPARRAINSDASRRGVVDEYVITNVQPGT